jgi:hypothetical protein
MCGQQQEENKQIVPIENSSIQPLPPNYGKVRANQGRVLAAITALVCSNLFSLFVASVYEYLSLRGVLNVDASRYVLLFCWLIGFAGIVSCIVLIRNKQRVLTILLSALILAVALVGLDRIVSALKPLQPTTMPTAAAIAAELFRLVPGLAPNKPEPSMAHEKSKSEENRHRPATFKQLFENGWPNLTAYYNVSTLKLSTGMVQAEIKLPWRLNGDFGARSRFLEFFLDNNVFPEEALAACVFISKNYQQFIDVADSNIDIAGQLPEDSSVTHFKDMVFSGRIFIYYQNPDLSLQQKSALESLYKQSGLSLQFRGEDYALLHRTDHPPLRDKPVVPNDVLLPDPGNSGLMLTLKNLNQKK